MRTGRTPAPIVALPPIPRADGDRVEAVAARRPSAALAITDRVAAEAGEIARPALAAGEAAVAAEAGAVAVAASAAVASVAAVAGGNSGACFWISADVAAENLAVNHEVQRLEDGNVARQGHDFAVLRGLCTPRSGDFLRLVQQIAREASRYGSCTENICVSG